PGRRGRAGLAAARADRRAVGGRGCGAPVADPRTEGHRRGIPAGPPFAAYPHRVASRTISGAESTDFADALSSVHAARLRPEVRLTEVPAPTRLAPHAVAMTADIVDASDDEDRSEEHTSELQSRFELVCRLLLE